MRRHPLAAGSAILAAVLLVAVTTPPPALTSSATSPDMFLAPASTAASCTGWSSTYVPPPTINVGMVTSGSVSSVVQVPFMTYVQTVLAAEWGKGPGTTYLQIGALAVKQYGWYYAIHGRLNHTFMGQCFDVRSDTIDQVYDPVKHVPSAADDTAVTDTWQISMRKAGVFFLPHYNGTTQTACGAGGFTTGTLLPQQAVETCINEGMSRNAILHLYLDPPTPPLSIDDLVNLAGGDRYATAVAISAWHFHPGVPAVIMASGANFPDALAGGPAAARLGAPILLLPPTDDVPDGVATELQRLAPAQIIVLGGSGAISDAQFAALAAFAPGQDPAKVVRLAGATRYDTAIAVSQFAFPTQPGPPPVPPAVPIVFLANGSTFPDAMAGASAGARLGGPVLMEDPSRPVRRPDRPAGRTPAAPAGQDPRAGRIRLDPGRRRDRPRAVRPRRGPHRGTRPLHHGGGPGGRDVLRAARRSSTWPRASTSPMGWLAPRSAGRSCSCPARRPCRSRCCTRSGSWRPTSWSCSAATDR